jgi:hypothetical protein
VDGGKHNGDDGEQNGDRRENEDVVGANGDTFASQPCREC